MCWNDLRCMPCEPYGHDQSSDRATFTDWKDRCNAAFADACQGDCLPDWDWAEPICLPAA